MLLALAHTLVSEGLHDEAFLASYCVGFERVLPYVMGETDGQPKDADWAAAITGVPADTIRALARRMAATRTMVTASWSLQRADHGEQPYWAVVLLAVVRSARSACRAAASVSAMAPAPASPSRRSSFAAPAMDGIKQSARRRDPGGAHLRLPAASGRAPTTSTASAAPIPTSGWSIGRAAIRSIITRTPTGCARAWRRPETIIVHEPWWTATARHADIVLPATTSLERNDIGGAPRDRFVIAMQQAIEPVGEARSDFAIFSDLARRLGCEAPTRRAATRWAGCATSTSSWRERVRTNQAAIPDFDTFWQRRLSGNSAAAEEYVLFGDFRADPGQAQARARRRAGSSFIRRRSRASAMTIARRIRPGSSRAEWLGGDAARTYPLHLISSQPRYRLHSQMDRGPVSARRQGRRPRGDRDQPGGRAARGIADGDVVRVYNARGACLAGAVVTDAVSARRACSLSCGAWYDPADGSDSALCGTATPTC